MMPDPRPFTSLRGQYDDPPASASSTASTPRSRRNRLHHALEATADMTTRDLLDMRSTLPPLPQLPLPPLSARTAPRIPLQRRRQRSPALDDRGAWNEDSLGRRRPKRRRLDTEPSLPPKQPIKYGRYGQVEPGKLRFEIVSCDGGEHRDPRHPQTYLGSDNLLRHDKSVYCSDRPSSSIVLKHADDTPFCLEKLHVCGPETGFTAPVRAGLVYVAMTLNDLHKYMDPPHHARMNGVHTPPYRRHRSPYRSTSSSERITLSDALRDPEVSAAFDEGETSYADRADAAHDLAGQSYRANQYHSEGYDAETHCDLPTDAEAEDPLTYLEQSLPVTFLSDEEVGPEETSSQDVLDFRLHRERHMQRRRNYDGWDSDRARWAGLSREDRASDSWNLRRLDALMARTHMESSPQHGGAGDENEASYQQGPSPGYGPSYYQPQKEDGKSTGAEYYDDGLNDPNVTRARFQIKDGKYKVAIKFDPPISGRFILLKLWAHSSNVDVQSVIAKGYGGSRFFPAVEFR